MEKENKGVGRRRREGRKKEVRYMKTKTETRGEYNAKHFEYFKFGLRHQRTASF